MSLLRFVARSMFAGYFITEGVKAVTKPAESAPDAEAFASTVTPLLQRVVLGVRKAGPAEQRERVARRPQRCQEGGLGGEDRLRPGTPRPRRPRLRRWLGPPAGACR